MVLVVKNTPANAGDTRDVGSIPGSGRSPGEGNGNPLQYSCLGNLTNRGAWRATVHGVARNWTQLSDKTATDLFIWIVRKMVPAYMPACNVWEYLFPVSLLIWLLLFKKDDGWMASSTQWTWIWANSRKYWRTGKPGMLQFMRSQRVGHDWTTEQQRTGQHYWSLLIHSGFTS